MLTNRKPKLNLCIAFLLLCALCSFICGCADILRFAPSEPQKQSAELTHNLACKINAEGAQRASPASQQLVEGTRAELAYIGRPASPPDASKFDTVTAAANTDAVKRPDPWKAADNMLNLAIGVSALLGGVYGTKAVKFLNEAKQKSQALQEVITGNELFKDKAPPESVAIFKESQETAQVSPETYGIVAQLKP